MKLIEAHAKLIALDVPTFTTSEAAAALSISRNHAAQVLQRLAETAHVAHLARGRWALPNETDSFMLPEALTAPKPSYVSLQSALYHHEMIEQIPEVTYAVTLAPTRRVHTPLGDVSLHQVTPAFFFGFDVVATTGVKLATPEKALLDVFYLRPARSRRFRALPELELPKAFSTREAMAMTRKIASPSRRTLVQRELEQLLQRVRAA